MAPGPGSSWDPACILEAQQVSSPASFIAERGAVSVFRSSLIACIFLPSLAWGWGQPEHAVLGETVLRRFGEKLPAELSQPESRDAFVYGCFSPDGFLFHGPTYVHLDRHFAALLLARATDAREFALAYGWASHQQQDAAGHGRYIKEDGLDHLKKEVSLGTRVRYQGSGFEKRIIKSLKAIFDADLIHQASQDYADTHGPETKVISRRHAQVTGMGYGAYLTGLKGVMFATYYGKLRRNPDLYPRSEWQFAFDEAIGLTQDWCQNFGAFSRSSLDQLRSQNFLARLDSSRSVEVRPLETEPPERTKEAVLEAVDELLQTRAKAAHRPAFTDPGFEASRGDLPYSHVMVQDDLFLKMGAHLVASDAVEMRSQSDGSFTVVEPIVVDEAALLRELVQFLDDLPETVGVKNSDGFVGERGSFFQELQENAHKALDSIQP